MNKKKKLSVSESDSHVAGFVIANVMSKVIQILIVAHLIIGAQRMFKLRTNIWVINNYFK